MPAGCDRTRGKRTFDCRSVMGRGRRVGSGVVSRHGDVEVHDHPKARLDQYQEDRCQQHPAKRCPVAISRLPGFGGRLAWGYSPVIDEVRAG